MATYDLITLSRSKQNIPSITDSSKDTLLNTLITAASVQVQKWCRRNFYSKAYDEVYSGHGERQLMLRQYPIQSVQSVRYRPVTVIKITNTTQANIQARVSVTSTGLTLVRVNAGVKTTDTSITFAGNVTLTAVAAAVNALGNGWSAQIVGDATNYGSWPSSDLYWPPAFGDGLSNQGALQCVAGSFAELKMHTYELAGYQIDSRGWLLRAIPYTDPELVHPEDLVWPTGINNFRIQYTAGYTTIPEDVQEACAEFVSALYWQCQRDPGLKQESITHVLSRTAYITRMPTSTIELLTPYRNPNISNFSG